MTSKQTDSRRPVEDEEDLEWEVLVPARFKKVCTKDNWEPFHVSDDKSWWS